MKNKDAKEEQRTPSKTQLLESEKRKIPGAKLKGMGAKRL